jgi:hypothetical protein
MEDGTRFEPGLLGDLICVRVKIASEVQREHCVEDVVSMLVASRPCIITLA